jgi:hypothetical protein
MVEPRVLFTTKTYHNDFGPMANGGFSRKWQKCDYPFAEKWILINNVQDEDKVASLFKGGLDERAIKSSEYYQQALDFFGLTIADFKGGYYYSICELIELYLAKDFDYIVHFAGDCELDADGNWINPAIESLDGKIVTASPHCQGARMVDLDQFFSDQCYLIPVKKFRRKIYNLKEPVLPQYPPKGGDDFEHLVARYLHKFGKYRKVLGDFTYVHHNG